MQSKLESKMNLKEDQALLIELGEDGAVLGKWQPQSANLYPSKRAAPW